MSQIKPVVGLIVGTTAVMFGFVVWGWWMLVPFLAGLLWHLAKAQTQTPVAHIQSPPQPQLAGLGSTTNKVEQHPPAPVRDVRPWQERVEEIERGRPTEPPQPSITVISYIATHDSPTDQRIAALNRQATVHKENGDWPAAVACLKEAHGLMGKSGLAHTAQAWCRLPLFLQQAGRFDESMAVFDELLDQLPEMARRATGIGNKNIGPAQGKRSRYNWLVASYKKVYLEKRELAQSRQAKATARSASHLPEPHTATSSPNVDSAAIAAQGHAEIEACIARNDWDTARAAIQKVAYGMVDADPEQKARFTDCVKTFATRDPLYRAVMAEALPLILESPGMKQTQFYPVFPTIPTETIRYVFYYADQLGEIRRQKKGNSYLIFPLAYAAEAGKPT
jgi:tetratricopeptide (TPR) repeat protein